MARGIISQLERLIEGEKRKRRGKKKTASRIKKKRTGPRKKNGEFRKRR